MTSLTMTSTTPLFELQLSASQINQVRLKRKKTVSAEVYAVSKGAPGKSAYELAVENGYTGTLEDYVATTVSFETVHW